MRQGTKRRGEGTKASTETTIWQAQGEGGNLVYDATPPPRRPKWGRLGQRRRMARGRNGKACRPKGW